MKKLSAIIGTIAAVIIVLSLAMPAMANTTYQMDKGAPDAVESFGAIANGSSAIWIANEVSSGSDNFPASTWGGKIYTIVAPPVGTNTLTFDIGYSDGTAGNFTSAGTQTLSTNGIWVGYDISINADAFSVPTEDYLALRVTNNTGSTIDVDTGGSKQSYTLLLSSSIPLVWYLNDNEAVVDTGGEVGGGGSMPYICAIFETPDDDATKDGVQVIPEPPAPPLPPQNPDADGWKRVNFYVVVGDPNGVGDIAAVDVTVYYPQGTPYDGALKFQIRAITDLAGGWTAAGGPTANPTPYDWVAPIWTVRQLKYDHATNTWDKVDMNADGDTTDAEDLIVPDAMTALGSSVTYGPNPNISGNPAFTQAQVVADIQAGKQIMLELVGYMWFHQPALRYKVVAEGIDMSGGSTTPGLVNYFDYESIVSLYVDFNLIDWGSINLGVANYKYGDNDITTSGLPTVWNNGNEYAQIRVSGTKAYLTDPDGYVHLDKYIDSFDAHLDRKDPVTGAILQEGTILFSSADAPKLIVDVNGNPVLLPSCIPAQIDFSIHPPFGTRAGDYRGTITLSIEPYT